MASGDSSQPTLPADEVREASPQAARTILDDLSPSQAQHVLEAALQHYRMADEREPGRPAVTASALLNGGLLPAVTLTVSHHHTPLGPWLARAPAPTASVPVRSLARSCHPPGGG